MINTYKDIELKLKDVLKESRFVHTLGVANTAVSLAMRYEVNMEKAYLAGLLHDCAKAYKEDTYIDLANKYNIQISDAERLNPQLLHAKLGGYFAKEKYNVCDEEIINAINTHTTGIPDMSDLQKIIFTADYIEPNRTKQKRLNLIRKTAFINIDLAIFYILEDTLNYLKDTGSYIDETTVKTYEYYKGVING